MYEKLRNEFIVEINKSGMSNHDANVATSCLDYVAVNYKVVDKEANIVTFEQINKKTVDYYLACKSVEGFSAKTIKQKKYALELFFQYINKSIIDITALDVRGYLYHYQQERNISNYSLDGLRSVLQAFFSWLVDEDYLERNPMKKIKPIKHERKVRQPLEAIELEQLRRACTTSRERAVLDILYSTGCRCSEIAGIKLSDINFEEDSIKVTGKGNKQRIVYLNASAKLSLDIYLDYRKKLMGERTGDMLFISERRGAKNAPLTPEGIYRIVKDIASKAGDKVLKNVFPHLIRHTTATNALQNGMPVELVKEMLGHERIDTTMIYAKAAKDDVQRFHTKCVL